MTATHSLLDHVARFLSDAGVRPEHTVVVGFSGGPDSLALLWALATLQRVGRGPRVTALHVDHQLRPDSARDAERSAALALELGVSVEIVTVDVTAWPEYEREGTESAARAARYAALGQCAQRLGTPWIAVAHTRDDQVETVLLRLLRGTGLDGLAGMRPVSQRRVRLDPKGTRFAELTVLRPLLEVRRHQVHAVVELLGLVPIEDPSNRDPQFRRNRIRHEVIPLLEAIAPGASDVIARTSALLRDDADVLEAEAERAARSTLRRDDEVVWVDRERLATLPVALQRRVLRRAVSLASSGRAVPSVERIEAFRRASLGDGTGRRIELGGNLDALLEYNAVAIGPAPRLDEALRRASGLPTLAPGTTIRLSGEGEYALGNGWCLRYRTAADTSWLLRTRRPGDRLQLGGRTRPVRLQDWFVNRKVPGHLRNWLPLLAQDGIVWWIAGVLGLRFHHPDGQVEVELVRDERAREEMRTTVAEERIEPEQLGLERVLIDEATLQRRVAELGEEITAYYRGQRPLLVGVLTGAFVFMADLVRHMPIPLSIDFMAVSSYGQATVTSGVVRIIKDLDRPVEGEHLLLVEDIVDSGLTLRYFSDVLRRRNPASLKVVALLRKQKAGALQVPVDWVGFDIPDEFVVGYGLDVAGRFRNLPFIAVYRNQS